MTNLRYVAIAALVAAALLTCSAIAHAITESKLVEVPYYAKILYVDHVVIEKKIVLKPGDKYVIEPGLPPSRDYYHHVTIIDFGRPLYGVQIICSGSCMFEKNVAGLIVKVYSHGGKVQLSNAENKALSLDVRITYVYVKTSYAALNGTNATVVSIRVPDETFGRVSRQVVRLEIDNMIPYAIERVILPDGRDASELVGLVTSSSIAPAEAVTGVKVELKRAEIDASSAPHGEYKIVVRYDEQARLPTSFLVKGTQFMKSVVEPDSEITVLPSQFGVPSGWKLLGYVVAVAAFKLYVAEQSIESVKIDARRIVPVMLRSESIKVRGVSYMIPPVLRFRYLIGVYIVYDESFKIVNNLSMPLTVIYVPVVYKPVGTWQYYGRPYVEARVLSEDVSTGHWTVLVVQLPEIAYVEKIVTPGGLECADVVETELPWGSLSRPVSISPDRHEAYVTVAVGDLKETGVYRIYVTLEPIRVHVTTKSGRPLGGVKVVAHVDNDVIVTLTDRSGYALINLTRIPDSFVYAEVYYDGVKVKEIVIKSLVRKEVDVRIGLYNVTVIFVGARDQAIPNATVTLEQIDTGLMYMAITDSSGIARFNDVLEGTYVVTARYDGLTYTTTVEVDDNKVVKLKSDILAILGNIPITVAHAIAAVAGATMVPTLAFLAFKALHRRKEPSYEVISV